MNEYNKSATKFYFHWIKKLLEMHTFNKQENHHFYLSRRNKTTNERFDEVLKTVLHQEMKDENIQYKAEIVKSSEYPELCVIDYMLWAVQRFVLKGEKRFLKALEDKVVCVYDSANEKDKEFKAKQSIAEFLNKIGLCS